MLDGCLAIFEKQKDIDKLILDTYVPANGTYIIMKYNGTEFVQDELLDIKQDKKNRTLNITEMERMRISKLDYYCRLIDLNKSIKSKIIQSNSYLGFIIKKESLTNGKLTEEIINQYYAILSNPYLKYTKKKDKALYERMENELGKVSLENIMLVQKWIKENIFKLPMELKGNDYLKIFFQIEGADFKKEGKRYYIPNIYNKNDFNIEIVGHTYGLPNNNMGLNAKKTYLEHKSRISKVPVLEDVNRVMLKKKFFDYLLNQSAAGKCNIYLDSNTQKTYELDAMSSLNQEFTGYYLRIRKEKNEAAIVDMDRIALYQVALKDRFTMQNVLDIPTEKLEKVFYGETASLIQIKNSINEVFFSKYLLTNLFNEVGDVSISDSVLKESILLYRNAFANWFNKGYKNGIDQVIDQASNMLIRNSIANGYHEKVLHQFNLRWSLLEYFRGGKGNMADVLREKRELIWEKINSSSYVSIVSDEEYFYAVGQMIKFAMSLNKSGKKSHALANPFFHIKSNIILNERLKGIFLKYNYNQAMHGRFDKLYMMITSYKTDDDKVDQDTMIAGYIADSLIYEKSKGEK